MEVACVLPVPAVCHCQTYPAIYMATVLPYQGILRSRSCGPV